MIRSIAITSTLIIFATNGWATEVVSKSTHESMGIGSGAAIGAVAGGPVGLVFGAAMGLFSEICLIQSTMLEFRLRKGGQSCGRRLRR